MKVADDSCMDQDAFCEGSSDSSQENTDLVNAGELMLATISGLSKNGDVFVDYSDHKHKKAQSTVKLDASSIGRQVALMFVGQDINQPLVIGTIRSHLDSLIETYELSPQERLADENGINKEKLLNPNNELCHSAKDTNEVIVDGKKIAIEAKDELVFKCGESSITLTKNGKILIRGKYLVNRASGVNRILGGSVQIN